VKVLLGYFIVVSEVILSGLVVGETLRILLVSTQESIREEVEQALAGLPGDFRLYWVTRPDLVMVRASDLAPHLIIVDDALGDVDPAELIGQLAASLPTSALLSLVQRDALETARRAILLGARAFVAKPIVVEEAVSSFFAGPRAAQAARRSPSTPRSAWARSQGIPWSWSMPIMRPPPLMWR
jgi:DNA-binding NarL/FixJ family response regulator